MISPAPVKLQPSEERADQRERQTGKTTGSEKRKRGRCVADVAIAGSQDGRAWTLSLIR